MLDCDKVLTSFSGNISSPHYGFWKTDFNCRWVINVTSEYILKITFTTFEVSKLTSSKVYIKENNGVADTKVDSYSGTNPPILNRAYISFSNIVVVELENKKDSEVGYFALTYQSVKKCGNDITNFEGILENNVTSDGFFEPNLYCEWNFKAPSGYTWNLTFQYIDMSLDVPSECINKLELYENVVSFNPTYTFCQRSTKVAYRSDNNLYKIVFSTSEKSEHRRKGFRLIYKMLNFSCGGTLNATSTNQTFTSPNFPLPYETGVTCRWLIKGFKEQNVIIFFNTFQLLKTDLCRDESLSIINIDNSEKLLCGESTTLPSFKSVDEHLTILFKSVIREENNLKGFNITYAVTGCSQEFRAMTGRITSPNYPKEHRGNHNCNYKILAPSGTKLSLFFTDFKLEDDFRCEFDYLTVTDSSNRQIKKLCGFYKPGPLFLTDNIASLNFQTDDQDHFGGFDLTYIASHGGCGGTLQELKGLFTSPNYPNPPSTAYTCLWKIILPANYKFRMYLEITPTTASLKDCILEHSQLTIYDGPSELASHNSYCKPEANKTLNILKDTILIKYTSTNSTDENIVFQLLYEGSLHFHINNNNNNYITNFNIYSNAPVEGGNSYSTAPTPLSDDPHDGDDSGDDDDLF
ncbi:hypothetical protein HELRODRAFT_190380 [Helobdella robusta]|uniref:CUB domain-containing protein n=1 Tax=Helobdella robusta TaxID=6412 RepID=T1FRY0_HELRO|nr:hypothetical protein HELRODRAFT_190380 [Helobdella robusta]ESO10113.1 hypothetical protein HELRODRAFT_190380 [Helobdella robusta]